MGEAYFSLKRKLQELGYNNTLPVDAVPLVECILADLLQTTRSLQHYMELSKEALMQRDSLMMEAEPYKCDNAKLIQENNLLHKNIIQIKEEHLRLIKDSKRKLNSMSEELSGKDILISKLQHDVRDLSLRGLCAETLSSRNKSRRKDGGDCHSLPKLCICNDKTIPTDKDIQEMLKKIQVLQEKNDAYCDDIVLLKNQVEHRDNEIIRLNMLLEGGRPSTAISKDFCSEKPAGKIKSLMKQLNEMEIINENLKKEIDHSLEKQHEAMLRALNLADKNKKLQEELQKVDSLALKVEDDCNKRLAVMMNEVNFLQNKVDSLSKKNVELTKEMTERYSKDSSSKIYSIQESLNAALKEKDALQNEIKELLDLNKSLQEKIVTLSQVNKSFHTEINECGQYKENTKCFMKEELQKVLEDERKKYERYMSDIQQKINETMGLFNSYLSGKGKITSPCLSTSPESNFIRDLHGRLCESEQKYLLLKKENSKLKNCMDNVKGNSKQNYQDIISHLNNENAELSKENISLSQQLSQYKALNSTKYDENGASKQDIQKLKEKNEMLLSEIKLLRKDKDEYNLRNKKSMEMIEKLKRDLTFKHKEIEHLEEENSSYKMTNRTGKASADQLKDECNFLRDQIKRMQSDVMKEKTLASQIKNIQLETERNSCEVQNELICVQKKLSQSKDTIDLLEKKCKELQSEIISLRSEKSKLIDNMKCIDQERDKLVLELDTKSENLELIEQKLKSQTFEINKQEKEIADLKRKLTLNKVSEHKVSDYETQFNFLNGEILRLTQQYDTAIMENKQLQNSLADVNGTLKLTKIEFDKSRKEVETLRQQLQHYVAEIRRIEELLSQKEAERSDMLEQFASLSVEANILENTNHSLESESASKSLQLQTYVAKIQSLEAKLSDKDNLIDTQAARIAAMTCKITSLENEIKLITEEKIILEQNISCLKKMCNNLQCDQTNKTTSLNNMDSELTLFENRIKSLTNTKTKLENEKDEMKDKLTTTEKLLSNARREIVELKLALQDATSETKSLQDCVERLNRRDADIHEESLAKELQLPLMLEETIHEVSHEEDDDGIHYNETRKRYSKFSHGSTL